eukprot:CAMPEP_0176060188 /NCGR_PEP_ID=MMETSP0120_2-20121206/29997_1 /TAXON_ID=160619 /ORGANISM="Kryptoperidinium foliaceum, Strain CCMP 1326" /LENGTH=66 /DNA_ID=CAMNT_0017393727 /DNA_START=82 /DNA_END=279 /DNA_ORIENTATION=+
MDFSFLSDPGSFAKGHFDADDHDDDLRQSGAEPEAFVMAPVANPKTFCEDIKKSGAAPGLMDFKHG